MSRAQMISRRGWGWVLPQKPDANPFPRFRLLLRLHMLLLAVLAKVYLREHPNRTYQQYRSPRRERLSGVVVIHTAENTPDHVAFDGGAEAVARFISTRSDPGSYHTLADSDSTIRMVEYDDEAFHDATSGGNRHEIGLSVATRADVWPLAPKAWRDGAVEQIAHAAADAARHIKARTGIVVPARIITRAESERRIPGFISHGARDPGRRSDPGAHFPWDTFLARYAQLTNDPTRPPATGDLIMDAEVKAALANIQKTADKAATDARGALKWAKAGALYGRTAGQQKQIEAQAEAG